MRKQKPGRRRVVITGYGLVTPLGRNAAETFANAAEGRSGIGYIRSFDTEGLPCRIGGEVPAEWLTPWEDREGGRLEKYASRGLRLMRMAVSEAAAQAKLGDVTDRTRIGVALGTYGDNLAVEDIAFLHRYYDGHGRWDLNGLTRSEEGYDAFHFYRRKPDVAAGLLAHLHDCQGPEYAFGSACAAGAQAIGEAFSAVRAGACEVMIAGGCEAVLTPTSLIGFILLKALAEHYETPQQASRPFDRKRNGFVLSEGAGVMVLESRDHAVSRGANILGELLGYGSSADAFRITDPHPQGLGAVYAMQGALQDAGLRPEAIGYINAHGTSTLRNDLIETMAIKEVFGGRAKDIPVSSNKSMLGHSIAAAGAIEAVLTLMGVQRSRILPTINYEFPDPNCDLWYVPNKSIHREHRIALSNSFGFGGQNACLCLGRGSG